MTNLMAKLLIANFTTVEMFLGEMKKQAWVKNKTKKTTKSPNQGISKSVSIPGGSTV